MLTRPAAIIGGTLVLGLIAGGLATWLPTSGPYSRERVTIRVAHPLSDGTSALLEVARQKGLFGPSITVEPVAIIPSQMASLLDTGQVQFAMLASPMTEVAAAGSKKVTWAGMYSSTTDVVMLARPGIRHIADLKGKRIGISTPGSTLDLWTKWILAEAGLKEQEVTVVRMGTHTAAGTAFVAGQIDATVQGATAHLLMAQVPGATPIYDAVARDVKSFVGGGFAGNVEWMGAHRDATVAFLKGVNDALTAFRSDPSTAKQAVAKVLQLSGNDVEATYRRLITRRFMPTLQAVAAPRQIDVLRWLHANGFPEVGDSLSDQLLAGNIYVTEAVNVVSQ